MLTFTLTAVAIVAFTVVLHAIGTSVWLHYLGRHFGPTSGRSLSHLSTSLRVVTLTVVILLLLHSLEIVVWALVYLFFLPPDVLGTFEEATYFSFVTFTTLGYGDITLADEGRIMSGVEALNGIMLVGWSTALLFAVVQKTWQAEDAANSYAVSNSNTGD